MEKSALRKMREFVYIDINQRTREKTFSSDVYGEMRRL